MWVKANPEKLESELKVCPLKTEKYTKVGLDMPLL